VTRTTRLAIRTGFTADGLPACAALTDASVVPARAGRPADPSLPVTLERDPRQVEPDRSIQLARTPSLPPRMPQEGASATLATTGTGTRPPARTGSVLSLRLVADRRLDRSWDRADLTGARA
jgi:hypothetical protein